MIQKRIENILSKQTSIIGSRVYSTLYERGSDMIQTLKPTFWLSIN